MPLSSILINSILTDNKKSKGFKMESVILVYTIISIMAGYAIVRGGKILLIIGIILVILTLNSNPIIFTGNIIGYILGAVTAYLLKRKT